MKNINFIVILSFIAFTIEEKYDLLTIDLELNPNKRFRIKEETDDSMYTTFQVTHLGVLTKKSYDSFKQILEDNGFKCKKRYQFVEGLYISLKCDEKYGDFSSLKLIFNFEDHSLVFTTNELFTKEKNYYLFNFRTSSRGKMYWIPLGRFKDQ